MDASHDAIICSSLTKHYSTYKKLPGLIGSLKSFIARDVVKKTAINHIDIQIKKGEIIGLLGANGAGKTTLMKILSGIIVPSSGQVSVLGDKPYLRKNSFKRKIALAMGQKNQLMWDLPPFDSFKLIKEYYGVSKHDFQSRLDELVDLLDIKHILHVQMRRLSLGERMKIEIVACLLHAPELIMLDEPTIGLDVNAQEKLRNFFRLYHERNKPTVILTSHYMADIVSLCPRIVLMSEGLKIFDGKRSDLTKAISQKKRLHLVFEQSQHIDSRHPLLLDHQPHWINAHEVTLDIDQSQFKQVCANLLTELPIQDFDTQEVPFEAVMGKILQNPELLKQNEAKTI